MFNVYGKKQNNQHVGVIAKFLKNITENKPIVVYVDVKQKRDFISINDVVESFGCAIKSNTNKIYNIVSRVSISINELAEIMFDVFRKQEIKYFKKQKGDMQNSFADVSLAKKELCFTSRRSLKEELVRL